MSLIEAPKLVFIKQKRKKEKNCRGWTDNFSTHRTRKESTSTRFVEQTKRSETTFKATNYNVELIATKLLGADDDESDLHCDEEDCSKSSDDKLSFLSYTTDLYIICGNCLEYSTADLMCPEKTNKYIFLIFVMTRN